MYTDMAAPMSITRPVGRVRIETALRPWSNSVGKASPGRLAGCGLKQGSVFCQSVYRCITRPVGRVRIETSSNSSVMGYGNCASPGRLAGCGLKHFVDHQMPGGQKHHPAGWPGAD